MTADLKRVGLTPWIILCLILGIGLLAVSMLYGIQQTFWGPVLSSVGSALISAGVALCITDYLIEPLQTRNIIEMTGLRYELHEIGFKGMGSLIKNSQITFLTPQDSVTILCTVTVAGRILREIFDSVKGANSTVTLAISDASVEQIIKLGDSWKALSSSSADGPTINMYNWSHSQSLAFRSRSTFVVSVPGRQAEQDDPPLMRLDPWRSKSMFRDIHNIMDNVEGSSDAPGFSYPPRIGSDS